MDELLRRLSASGTGAVRQRATFRRHGLLREVVDGLAAETATA
ncbi:hypothetical protein ACODT5_12900 [Streptomyces sp. 5.8]